MIDPHARGTPVADVDAVRVLMIAPIGRGVGGIISQTNDLREAIRSNPAIDLRIIDSTQRYRPQHDLRFVRRAWGGARHALRILTALVSGLATFRPDVVHVASSGSIGLVRDVALVATARLFRTAVELRLHFGRVPQLAEARNWEWLLLRAACGMATRLAVLDEQTKLALIENVKSIAVDVVPNAISLTWVDSVLERATPRTADPTIPRVVFVGYVIPDKGVLELVRACTRLDAPGCELQVVGPVGSDVQVRLSHIAQTRSEGVWLSFTGAVGRADSLRAIASGDIFVLPSYSEGFPISILEAMACGVAIVATEVGAVPDMLNSRGSDPAGVVVAPRDEDALRAALQELLTNAARRRALAAAARERFLAHYELSRLVGTWQALWREAAGTRR